MIINKEVYVALSIKQTESLLIESSLNYIKNPTDAGKSEVRYYAELLLQLSQSSK